MAKDERSCTTCLFYHPINDGRKPPLGECRLHPKPARGTAIMVDANDWCGQRKLRPMDMQTELHHPKT